MVSARLPHGATSDPTLAVENLGVSLGGVEILTAVSMKAFESSVTCVVGPSGSGKSTLLRSIAGLLKVTSGRMLLNGDDLALTPVHRRAIGMVTQEANLFPHLDVGRNVGFGLRMQGIGRDLIRDRVSETLELVGLAGFEGRSVNTLSGGQRQRAALARALAPRPQLLLLDEPFGSLDRSLRDRLVVELGQLTVELGLTVVHVTHDQQEAAELGQQLVVLREGTVACAGAPADAFTRPPDGWTARFLGHRNVLDRTDAPGLSQELELEAGQCALIPEDAILVGPRRREGGGGVGLPGPVDAAGGLEIACRIGEIRTPPARAGVRLEFDGGQLWADLSALGGLGHSTGDDVVALVPASKILRLPVGSGAIGEGGNQRKCDE